MLRQRIIQLMAISTLIIRFVSTFMHDDTSEISVGLLHLFCSCHSNCFVYTSRSNCENSQLHSICDVKSNENTFLFSFWKIQTRFESYPTQFRNKTRSTLKHIKSTRDFPFRHKQGQERKNKQHS